MKARLLLVSLVVCGLATVSVSAAPVNCAATQIIGSLPIDGCTIGDKLFFYFDVAGTGGTAADIAVDISTSGGEYFLKFSGAGHSPLISVPADKDSVVVQIMYSVMTISGLPRIKDLDVALGDISSTGLATGTARADEWACFGYPCKLADVHLAVDSPGQSNTITFDPANSLTLFTQVKVTRTGDGTVSLDWVENSISQVPEPATCFLTGSALLALTALRRRGHTT